MRGIDRVGQKFNRILRISIKPLYIPVIALQPAPGVLLRAGARHIRAAGVWLSRRGAVG